MEEKLEELRNQLIYEIDIDESTEEQLIQLVNSSIAKLRDFLAYYGIDFEKLEEYIDSSAGIINEKIKKMNQDNKEEIIGEVKAILYKFQNTIEEKNEENEEYEKDEEDNSNVANEETIEIDSRKQARLITSEIEDFLRDIREKAISLMNAYGINYSKIDEIVYDINSVINKEILDSEDKVYEILSNEVERVEEKLNDGITQILNDTKTKSEEFKEELNAGISLEEQYEFAKEQEKNDDNENKKLPQIGKDNILY